MGKWASYQKRGRVRHFGQFAAPAIADWSITNVTASTMTLTRVATAPTGATGLWGRIKISSTSSWTTPVYNPNGVAYTGLTTGTLYDAQVAWGSPVQIMSDFSSTKQQLLP